MTFEIKLDLFINYTGVFIFNHLFVNINLKIVK